MKRTLFIYLIAIAGAFAASAQTPSFADQLDGVFAVLEKTEPKEQAIDFDAIFGKEFLSEPTANNQAIDFDAIFGDTEYIDFDAIFGKEDPVLGALAALDNSYADAAFKGVIDNLDKLLSSPSGGYLTTVGPGYTGGSYTGASHSAILPGAAVLPVSGIITSRFGYRPRFKRMHKGIDIALKVGDTICSAMQGTVSRVDNDPKGYGLYVVVRHANGFETRYGHLSGTMVFPGAQVEAGQPIALGGNTGNSTGPHLHFETRVNGTAVDPASMFDFSKPSMKIRPWNQTPADNYGIAGYQPSNNSAVKNMAEPKGTYIVKAGDTLETVARATGIPVLKLCNLNMLSVGQTLQPGRMLRLR